LRSPASELDCADGLESSSKMQILFYFVIVVHVLVCFFLIGVVLLQQGRSADLAGAFGGQGSQTAFGPRAAANVLTRLTTWSAVIFMCTSISLVVLFVHNAGSHSVLDTGSHPAPASAPAKPGK
jgi:preprotein translocase subunit SecG